MILEILYFLYCAFIDFLFFTITDVAVKRSLRGASGRRDEQVIWLFECFTLLVFSLLIYAYHHTPYVLLLLLACTFIATQFIIGGPRNFVPTLRSVGFVLADKWQAFLHCWIFPLMNKWDEFQQHEQSMKESSKRLQQQQMMQQNIPPGMFPNNRPHNFMPNPQVYNFHQIHVSPRRPIRRYIETPPFRHLPYQKFEPVRQPGNHPSNVPSERTCIQEKNTSATISSRIKAALGTESFYNVPYGLRNQNENLCFMNSMLQCLSKSPQLGTLLSGSDVYCTGTMSTLVKTGKDLLYELSHKRGYKLMSISNSTPFRLAASAVDPSMVASPDSEEGGQTQQDAAEFLTWLLDILHSGTNASSGSGVNGAVKGASCDNDSASPNSNTLAVLKFIYGDLTLKRIDDMKKACLKDIEAASGFDNANHAEPMQRLSDLEWITHKQENKSSIDDLFTGQLVEAVHCLSCSRVSVSIQTFNILPVPIVEPRECSGVVYLVDCFSKFGNMENMFGSDGLHCPCSNKNPATPIPTTAPSTNNFNRSPAGQHITPMTRVGGRILSKDSAVDSPAPSQSLFMSPIPGCRAEGFNDSGFQDNVFKTSTPIGGERMLSSLLKTPVLTNGQKRSLLRQLPECLIVHLMRFCYNQRFQDLCKIHTPVNIPLKGLDLNSVVFDNVVQREDLTAPPEGYEYDLYAVCLHLGAGSTTCGHYISYCMLDDQTWWKFDDDKVTQVNMKFEINTRLVRENAYILFYKRKTASS